MIISSCSTTLYVRRKQFQVLKRLILFVICEEGRSAETQQLYVKQVSNIADERNAFANGLCSKCTYSCALIPCKSENTFWECYRKVAEAENICNSTADIFKYVLYSKRIQFLQSTASGKPDCFASCTVQDFKYNNLND